MTVYRLVSQGTIEEKILQRQEMKRTLADEVIGGDDEGFKDLGTAELLSLFRLDEGQPKPALPGPAPSAPSMPDTANGLIARSCSQERL